MLFVPPSMPFMVPEVEAQASVNLSFESLNITGDSDWTGPSIIVVVGESWHVTPTLAWEGTLPGNFTTGEPLIKGEIRYPDGTVYESMTWSMLSDGSVDYDAKTITLDTWSGQFYTNTDWPIGGYLVTITADTGNVLSETNESDNVIERLDLWSSCTYYGPTVGDVCVADVADTTPPVILILGEGGYATSHFDRVAMNSTGYNFTWTAFASDKDDNGDNVPFVEWGYYYTTSAGSPSWIGALHMSCSPSQGALIPVGTTTVTCTATDEAGNVGTASFTVTVVLEDADTTPPTVIATAYLNDTSPTGRTFFMYGTDVGPALEAYGNSDSYTLSWAPITAFFTATISSDATNSVVWPTATPGVGPGSHDYWAGAINFCKSIEYNSPWCPGFGNGWQTPIPTDWIAGTYTVAWETNNLGIGSTSVTVPALPSGDTTPPVIYIHPSLVDGILEVTQNRIAMNSTGYNITYTATAFDKDDNGDYVPDRSYYYHTPGGNSSISGALNMSCSPSQGALIPVGTTTVTCTATDEAGNVGTASFTVTVTLEGSDTSPATIAATAYLNATSPTGRTLSMVGVDIGTVDQYENLQTSISKDGTVRIGHSVGSTTIINNSWQPTWQIPIPEDWEAGTYNITWDVNQTPIGCDNSSCWVVWSGGTTVTIPALPDTAAETEIVIPSWIKNNAGWWASNQIDDRAFVSGLQWLISNGIMNIPPTEQGAGSDDVIPGWIKNNAGWWADDLIDDRNFVTGLQWLITNGIMVIG